MRAIRQWGLGKFMIGAAGTMAVLMLIPSGDAGGPAANQSVLSTAPELTRFLDNAIAPAPATMTSAEVIASVAAAPEIGVTSPVPNLALPKAPITATVPATQPDEPRELTSVRTAVNMRSGPSTNHATLFVLQPDEEVRIVSRDGAWAQVEKTNGPTGWVYGSYLGADEAGDPATAAIVPKGKGVREASIARPSKSDASGGGIRLRAAPSTSAATLFSVEPGTQLRVAERRNGWARVVVPGGMSGWVRVGR